MDVGKILSDLRQERDQLEEAIISLERLVRARGNRRGRPPAWLAEVKRRGRPPGSKNKKHDAEKDESMSQAAQAAVSSPGIQAASAAA